MNTKAFVTVLLGLLTGSSRIPAQSPTLTITGSACPGSLLTVRCSEAPARIIWTYQSAQLRTDYCTWQPNGVTIAGGNNPGSASDQFAGITDFVVDAAGNVYVNDAGNYRVQKWVPGAADGVTVAGGNGPGSAADQFRSSDGVVVDGSGCVYVADYENFRVQKWCPGATAGVMVAGGNDVGAGPDQFNSIYDLALDAASNLYVCGNPVLFTAATINGGRQPSFTWTINDRAVGSTAALFSTETLADGDVVSCRMINDEACTLPATSNAIVMEVRPTPRLIVSATDTAILYGGSTELQVQTDADLRTVHWSPENGLERPGDPRTVAQPAGPTTYEVAVEAANGCPVEGTVYGNVRMPSAFTPNGDGHNELFRIPEALPVTLSNFSVYDRWGTCVRATRNSRQGWDGT